MKLFHLDTSPKGEWSNSRALSRHFVHRLTSASPDIEIDYLDLAVDTPPHVTGAWAEATYTPIENRTEAMKVILADSDALCRRLLDADALLFALPMYNFGMPSAFKAFVDAVVRAGLTYIATPDGQYAGQLAGKKTLFITTRGADLRPGGPMEGFDALTPGLRAAFGFLGVAQPAFVDAQPVHFADPLSRAEALKRAEDELDAIATTWTKEMVPA